MLWKMNLYLIDITDKILGNNYGYKEGFEKRKKNHEESKLDQ